MGCSDSATSAEADGGGDGKLVRLLEVEDAPRSDGFHESDTPEDLWLTRHANRHSGCQKGIVIGDGDENEGIYAGKTSRTDLLRVARDRKNTDQLIVGDDMGRVFRRWLTWHMQPRSVGDYAGTGEQRKDSGCELVRSNEHAYQ